MLKTYDKSAADLLHKLDNDYYQNAGFLNEKGQVLRHVPKEEIINSYFYSMRMKELSYAMLQDFDGGKSLKSMFKAVAQKYPKHVVEGFKDSLWNGMDNVAIHSFLDNMSMDEDPFAKCSDYNSVLFDADIHGRAVKVLATYARDTAGDAVVCFSPLSVAGRWAAEREMQEMLNNFAEVTGVIADPKQQAVYLHTVADFSVSALPKEQFVKYKCNEDTGSEWVMLDKKPSILDHMIVRNTEDPENLCRYEYLSDNKDHLDSISRQHEVATHRKFMVANNLV